MEDLVRIASRLHLGETVAACMYDSGTIPIVVFRCTGAVYTSTRAPFTSAENHTSSTTKGTTVVSFRSGHGQFHGCGSVADKQCPAWVRLTPNSWFCRSTVFWLRSSSSWLAAKSMPLVFRDWSGQHNYFYLAVGCILRFARINQNDWQQYYFGVRFSMWAFWTIIVRPA